MTANLYEILGVAPGAEDPVIRAAYRALIRIYHPDRNEDPAAQARAREVTAAFSVLGDPTKRAAYDEERLSAAIAMPEPWRAADRGSPPMRNLGLASIAVALAVSLAFALPTSRPLSRPHGLRNLIVYRGLAAAVPPLKALTGRAEPQPDKPVLAAPAAQPETGAPSPTRAAVPTRPPSPQAVQLDFAEAPPRTAVDGPAPAAAVAESGGDRRAQMERLAAGFLKQSLEHADSHKQQLLLSARTRSAAARNTCQSDDCVTSAYLRQIRDTTEIMEGRVPNP